MMVVRKEDGKYYIAVKSFGCWRYWRDDGMWFGNWKDANCFTLKSDASIRLASVSTQDSSFDNHCQ